MKYIADFDRNQLLISSKARAQAAAQFGRKFPQKNKKGDGSRGTIPSMFQRIFRIDAIRGVKNPIRSDGRRRSVGIRMPL
ncbi:MAG: hypothetical protein ABSH16_04675 [Sedimentisphaerales bacterium]